MAMTFTHPDVGCSATEVESLKSCRPLTLGRFSDDFQTPRPAAALEDFGVVPRGRRPLFEGERGVIAAPLRNSLAPLGGIIARVCGYSGFSTSLQMPSGRGARVGAANVRSVRVRSTLVCGTLARNALPEKNPPPKKNSAPSENLPSSKPPLSPITSPPPKSPLSSKPPPPPKNLRLLRNPHSSKLPPPP